MEWISFDDLLNAYGLTQDDLESIDPALVGKIEGNGIYLDCSDHDENGLPAFYDAYLGVDITLKPSQGEAHA